MNLNAKYDVFVSYSRKDYVDEQGNPIDGNPISAILSFLDDNDITYWFDKDGIYSGSEFVEIITDAITGSKMMIFVSSEHSNASPWTTGEIFEAIEQEKLIVPFKIDNSSYNKKYRMMVRPLDYIEYFSNPAVAFDSLLKAIKTCKDEYDKAIAEEEKRKAEEDAKQRRAKIIEEIKTESLDFHRKASTLAQDAHKLVEKQKSVGIMEKKCPVCNELQSIEHRYCKKCGWTFSPIFDAHPEGDKDHLFVMRSVWNAVHETDAIRINLENKIQELESLRKENNALGDMVQSLKQQLEAAKSEALHISEQLKEAEDKARRRVEEEKMYDVVTVGNVKFKMIHVEGGGFTMGEGSEAHQVKLSSYYIGETPVTQALWKEVMGTNPSNFKGDQRPVESVSWYDCQEFIKKLNVKTGKRFRLLTEAEWEFAARGGKKSKGYEYSGSNHINEVAWYEKNAYNKGTSSSDYGTHVVKQKKPNELDIYDMSGNVWEWCQDWHGYYDKDCQTNPTGPDKGSFRVNRGGSWYYDTKFCRSSYRSSDHPNSSSFNLGFRLALSDS